MIDEPLLSTSSTPAGYLCFVLHAHLPWVRHPENDYMLEENWLFEGITETYLPLLAQFEGLVADKVPFKITMSLTPTLCSMFSDTLLQERYRRYLNKSIELAKKECVRRKKAPAFLSLAEFYLDRLQYLRILYEELYGCNLVGAFKKFMTSDNLEIITCAATHGFLPSMQQSPNAVNAQIAIAVASHEEHFGVPARGIWLPECGYYPGLETVLARHGITYFFVDTHALEHADELPLRNTVAPIVCRMAPVAAFARDKDSSKSVWSADEGYPGDPFYRDFHKDLGFDEKMEYIAPYIDPAGIRIATGFKYYRVTSRHIDQKEPYKRSEALLSAELHAEDFLAKRLGAMREVGASLDRPPLFVAPYDAELFGHWWFEGPNWLNNCFRKAIDYEGVEFITPSEYLARHGENQIAEPSFSSWGEGGYSGVWINDTNDWIYPYLARMEEYMVAYANALPDAEGDVERMLNQMVRELLLAQSSDWAFIMKSDTTVTYAVRRTKEHIIAFWQLCDNVEKGEVDVTVLADLERRNNLFPHVNYRVYRD